MQITTDHIKIAKKASKRYSKHLNKDELWSCILTGIFKAQSSFDETKSKLTTHIYNNVRWECLGQMQFNQRSHLPITKDFANKFQAEEQDNSFELLIDKYVIRLSYKELEQKYSKSRQELKKQIEVLKNLYISLNS